MTTAATTATPPHAITLFLLLICCLLVLFPYSTTAFSAVTRTAVHDLVNGNVPYRSILAEADRSFRLGIQLEKNGQAKQSAAAFHEAATLYQCVLDSPDEFQHVTSLCEEDCRSILGYACLSLGYLNLDVLRNPSAAKRLYETASEMDPSSVSLDGVGQSLEASLETARTLSDAIGYYQTALQLQPDNYKVQFHLAVALDRNNETDAANELFEKLRRQEAIHSCLVDSWGYVRWHTRKQRSPNLYRGTADMLALAIDNTVLSEQAMVCEFGVGSGRTLRITQELLPLNVSIRGFDCFTGLPQAWGTEPAGTYSTGGQVPNMEGKVEFYKGLFSETIPKFLKTVPDDYYLAYANIDCQLYTSTLDILENLQNFIYPGTILVFGEYICHPSWRQDEFRAFRECCKRFGWKYEYLAFSMSTNQAVVRITDA